MRYTLIFLILSASVYGQQRHDTLKYQLSKHGQHTGKGVDYTSLFQVGDTVTTNKLKQPMTFTIQMIHWRNKKVLFEYFGGNGWFLEGDLRRK